ncbi:MAG: CBS domain-containing protein [Pirellulales bacterium]|nr:CBS domain-containing protein [Pirellulales bacterium]
MLTVRAIMGQKLVTVSPESSIQEGIELMLSEGISGLPVVDKQGSLVGIVTEFALLGLAYDDKIRQDTVAQHMTTDVLTIEADDPVSKVADLCLVHRVRRVPVMDQGKLVGLVARRDVLKALYESKAPVCTA